MVDRPILFSGPMVRALLEGRKSQTRRVIANGISGEAPAKSQRFAVGDRLYVREAHYLTDDGDQDQAVYAADDEEVKQHLAEVEALPAYFSDEVRKRHARLRPPMHMPRWASRLTLTVTGVRVQRVQEISETDAASEGCFKGKATGRIFHNETSMRLGGDEWANARDWYADLWDSLNAKRGFGWDANPWIVAVSFTVDHRNIDQVSQ